MLFITLPTLADYNYQDLNLKADHQASIQSYIRYELNIPQFTRFYQNPVNEIQYVDQVFQKGDGLVFIKSNLKAPSSYLEQFIPHRKGLIYNTKNGDHYLSFYFIAISKETSEAIVKAVKAKLSHKKFVWQDLFISEAYASDNPVNCETAPPPETLNPQVAKQLEGYSNELSAEFLITQSTSCIQQTLAGAWNATGGMVKDIGRGIMSFLRNPIKSSVEFWDGAVDTFKATKNFLVNIRSELKALGTTLASLDTSTQVALVCQLVGSIGATTLVGVLTRGPAGLSSGLVKLALQTKRVKELAKVFKSFDLLKDTLPSGVEVKDLIGKALSTTQTRVLEQLKSLSEFRLPYLTQRYALCAL